ncbi:hypothetical protein ILYODFUR_021086 [Ilyodon furcidens]|uniref:Uncharacterized protein n=1 Tax=Ilyodon furcidens TaxID=33524 RepID=A0ABV0UHU5_9TELE
MYGNLDDLIECFMTITSHSSFDHSTVRKVSGFLRMEQDEDFWFFLQLFHQIRPRVDMMYQQLQGRTLTWCSSNVPCRTSPAVFKPSGQTFICLDFPPPVPCSHHRSQCNLRTSYFMKIPV